MRKISIRFLAVLLITSFVCQLSFVPFAFAEETTQATFVVKNISVTNNLQNEGAETFTVDSITVNKNVDTPSTVVVSTYKDNKLCAIKTVPLSSGTDDVMASNIGLTQNGLVTDYTVKAYVLDNLQTMKPLATPYIYGTREPAVLTSLSADSGTFGNSITINGNGFSTVTDLNKVYFTETATGLKLEAGVIEITATTVKVIAPVVNSGAHKVTVEIEGSVSNELDFTATAMIEPTGNETTMLLSVSNSLVSTSCNIVDIFNNSSLGEQQKNDLAQFLTDSTTNLSNATESFENLSPEGRNLINKILANGEMPEILDEIGGNEGSSTQSIMLQASMQQSGISPDLSTISIIDDVDQLVQKVRTARNTVRTINTALKYSVAALVATGAACSIFGGSGSALIALATEMESFRNSVIVPVLEVLSSIYTVLSCAMTSATAGSLEFTYSDDIQIDQYFSKMTEVPSITPPPSTLKSKLALVNINIDDVLYYREEIMNALEMPYIEGSTAKLNSNNFIDLLNNLLDCRIYSIDLTKLAFNEDGSVKPAAELAQNASQIKGVLRQLKKTSSSVANRANDCLIDIYYLRENLRISGYSLSEKWSTITKFLLEDTMSASEKLETMLNDLVYTFSYPSNIVEEVDTTPQYDGFVDDSGVLLAGQNYYAIGNMDFNIGINKSQAIDLMTDNIVTSYLTEKVVGLVDLDIDLVNVPVRLTCESNDESVITASWSDSYGLQIKPLKPGKATLKVYPNIEYVRSGKIKKEYLMINKEFEVVSGDYISSNYNSNNQLGPRIDSVKDDSGADTMQGYLGENINIKGKGFSSIPSRFQNIYMTGVPTISIDTLIPHFLTSYKQSDEKFKRENITLEIPDTLSGDMRVAVGLNQKGESVLEENRNNWLSNPINIEILKPIINFMPSNLIKGESYPVIGRGFSHTPKFNKIIFGDEEKTYSTPTKDYFSIAEPSIETPFATPIEYDKVNEENHNILHRLHNRLTFMAPSDVMNSTQNSIKSLETDEMKVTSNGSVIKSFGADVAVSNPNNIGMRPVIAYDGATNKRLAMWVDANENGGSVLVSSFIDSNGNMSDTAFVADNLGSIETAPDKIALCAKNGKLYATYVGKGTNNNDEIFLIINDGNGWSMPKNISLSSQSSIKPAITADDFDYDGDIDVLIFNIEDNGTNSNLQATILSYNDFSGYSTVFQNTVWQQSNTTPALYSENGMVAVAFNEYVGSASNIYVSKPSITGHNDTLTLDINPAIKLSDNSSYNKAENPSVVIAKNPVDNKDRICAVWENSANNNREDIFMATVENGVKSEITNLTNSTLHSQGAVLSKGTDETIALAFIEQGFEDISTERTQGFNSKLYFTRSFDGGLNFQRPYMCMKDYGDNGVRLGQIGIANQGSGNINLIWQCDNKIMLKTTSGTIIPPQIHYANTKIPRQEILSYSYNDNTYKLTNASGNAIRNIFCADVNLYYGAEFSSRLSVSPSGRYIAIPSYWLRIAEADGAFPIDICLPHNSERNYPKHVNWSDDENKLTVTFIEYGIFSLSPKGIMNMNATQGGSTNTFGYDNPKSSRYIYSKRWNDEAWNYHHDYYIANDYGVKKELFTSLPNSVISMSPDGNALLYVDNYSGNAFKGLCVNVIDGATVQITDKDVMYAVFSSDGSKIAYITKNDNNKDAVFMLDMATRITTELYEIPDGDICAIRFTPDDSSITLATSLSMVSISIESKTVTTTKDFVNDFVAVGKKNESIIVNNGISLIKPSGTGSTSVKLSKKPSDNVTISINCPSGIVANKTALTFTPDNYNTIQEFTVSSTSDNTLGLSVINLVAQGTDYVYNGVKTNVIVATIQGNPFTAGAGFIAAGYSANVAYPIIHNWSRQSIYMASNGTDLLWQTTNGSKVLSDGNGTTIVYDQNSYNITAYSKTGAKLWECVGGSPVLVDNKVYYANDSFKYRDITTGAETNINLVDTNNTGKSYYLSDIFFVDSQKNIYATAITYEYYNGSFHHIMKISPDVSFKAVMVTEQRVMGGCSLPLVTSDGKIIVHNDKDVDKYVNFYDTETLSNEGMVWGYDSVLNIAAIDQNEPNHSIFYVTTKDDIANTVTIKAMRTYDNSALWSRTFEGAVEVNNNPAITDDGIIYLPVNNTMYAIDANYGRIFWQYDSEKYIGGSPVIDSEGTIYFTAGTDLVALNSNGTLLKRQTYATNGTFESNVVIGNEGQIYFGGGVDSNNAKLPIYCIGTLETSPKAGTVYIEESTVIVDEDDGDIFLKVVDDSLGVKGGFTADIMLVPDTATLGNDYYLDWTHTNNQIVFAEGESEKYIKINIFDGYEVSPLRKFKVKLSAITGDKQLNSDFTDVTIKDVSLPTDEKFKVGFEKAEIALKEGTDATITVNRGANEKGLYPASVVKIVVGSEGSYNYFAKAIDGTDYTILPSSNNELLTLQFAEGEISKSIVVTSLNNQESSNTRKLDLRIKTNSAMQGDYSFPQQYMSQTKVYIVDSSFTVPTPIVKVLKGNDVKISNILYWGRFEVYNPQGEKLFDINGYQNSTDAEYSIGTLPIGNDYKARGFFADTYADTYFSVN